MAVAGAAANVFKAEFVNGNLVLGSRSFIVNGVKTLTPEDALFDLLTSPKEVFLVNSSGDERERLTGYWEAYQKLEMMQIRERLVEYVLLHQRKLALVYISWKDGKGEQRRLWGRVLPENAADIEFTFSGVILPSATKADVSEAEVMSYAFYETLSNLYFAMRVSESMSRTIGKNYWEQPVPKVTYGVVGDLLRKAGADEAG